MATRTRAPADMIAVRELEIISDNDFALYKRKQEFHKTALRKIAQGKYDRSKLPKLFKYLADEVDKSYNKQYGSGRGFMTNVATREALAEEFAKDFHAMTKGGKSFGELDYLAKEAGIKMKAAKKKATKKKAAKKTTKKILEGYKAIEYARRYKRKLNKYEDPIEGARIGLSVSEAEQVAREDPSLIYLEVRSTKKATKKVAKKRFAITAGKTTVIDADGRRWGVLRKTPGVSGSWTLQGDRGQIVESEASIRRFYTKAPSAKKTAKKSAKTKYKRNDLLGITVEDSTGRTREFFGRVTDVATDGLAVRENDYFAGSQRRALNLMRAPGGAGMELSASGLSRRLPVKKIRVIARANDNDATVKMVSRSFEVVGGVIKPKRKKATKKKAAKKTSSNDSAILAGIRAGLK